ncbi:hypothetical protein [Novosphingobium sp. 9U]|uniref:hypothetical protein n=1 Tax=Novosphingobium sp. 9U TaxID=2653158 RepID=UPI0012F3BBB9|nr:hypothetical protein [Novosphingobium sp. 9U]VWX50072.1 conserved hypothetical protein [Novosphingobium sp. 9U]
MTPTIDERLASVIRSLTDVILPSLPGDAGMAQEQLHMCVGHLGILRSQIDGAAAYEAEELGDARQLAEALVAIEGLGAAVSDAREALAALCRQADGDPRAHRLALNSAIDELVAAAGEEGDAAVMSPIRQVILRFEGARIAKDRRWFAPFGFDTIEA